VVMTADVEPESEQSFSLRPPFTVDILFDHPVSDARCEVLEGQLVVSPAPEIRHNRAADRLQTILNRLLPNRVEAVTNTAVRTPDRDGPIPDLLVVSVGDDDFPRGVPAEFVHTVIEVVPAKHPSIDRGLKKGLYAAAGISCYWRVELRPWRQHLGALPAIVVRLLGEDGDHHETLYAAGTTAELPIVVGSGLELVSVELDPAVLVGPRRRQSE
jgi:Uma2 family endonuclease